MHHAVSTDPTPSTEVKARTETETSDCLYWTHMHTTLQLRQGSSPISRLFINGLYDTSSFSQIYNESSGEITGDSSSGVMGKRSERNEDPRMVQVWERMSVSKLANGLRLNPSKLL